MNCKIYGTKGLISKTRKHNSHSSIRPNYLYAKNKELAILKKKIKWLKMENEFIKSSMKWWKIKRKNKLYL
ncbi:hypothetical protein [Spiroplasma endosymbiont of Cantharis nigra]|uniref:hypothetical protein n=1 Tax=Spiroplasma endosymbiont of Cantharis nigra TaxID=3066278 RepID=UPI0030CDA090